MPTTTPLTNNKHLTGWVSEMAAMCQPDNVRWLDGSEEEKKELTDYAVSKGILIPLNPDKHPGSYLHRSNPNDVARVEHLTFICTPTKDEAGPTNNWMDPKEAYAKLKGLFTGSMKGRTMYVVPYVMGPIGSPHSKVGIELTDSVYVALNMRIMTRMGRQALDMLGASPGFNKGMHCTGDVNPDRRYICHFPEDNAIWSFGSGYGGNALLGKKCLALRIGSYLGKKEEWLAEHMLILGLESPEGHVTYVAAAFPSACGKTNLSMLIPPKRFAGWKVWTVGDDIAWLRVGEDGKLYAVNPENGYFGVAPGTNWKSNYNAMKCVEKDTIFTNVAVTKDMQVWWEGMSEPPDELTDWKGQPWKKGSTEKAAHPNSRFTAPATNNPMLSAQVNDPRGVPISAIIFGGRRSNTIPLVLQSFNWAHGVYLGATLASETTAAATGAQGVVRRDPMAMLPFAGYNMADYWQHWLDMQKRIPYPPKIFMVNWFRKSTKDGKFLWPGYGDNMRVLKWVVDRAHGSTGAQETLFGWVPKQGHIDLSGLDMDPERLDEATTIVDSEWREELVAQKTWFDTFGAHLPKPLELIRQQLAARLS